MRIKTPALQWVTKTLPRLVERALTERVPTTSTAITIGDLFEVKGARRVHAVAEPGPGTAKEFERQFTNSARYGLLSAKQLTELRADLSSTGASHALFFKLNGAVSAALANPTLQLLNLSERVTSDLGPSERRSAERELTLLRRLLEPKPE